MYVGIALVFYIQVPEWILHTGLVDVLFLIRAIDDVETTVAFELSLVSNEDNSDNHGDQHRVQWISLHRYVWE